MSKVRFLDKNRYRLKYRVSFEVTVQADGLDVCDADERVQDYEIIDVIEEKIEDWATDKGRPNIEFLEAE